MPKNLPPSVASWPNRMLNIREVAAITGLSKATIYEWMARGTFPTSRRLGPNRIAWPADSIADWLESRPSNRESVAA